uniref:Uncharacterized protein n=1 Tax=Meloidogyne floridensis TaxID=298350 RepID=A0A915NDK5_9BILA
MDSPCSSSSILNIPATNVLVSNFGNTENEDIVNP